MTQTLKCSKCGSKGTIEEMSDGYLAYNDNPVCARIRCRKCGHRPKTFEQYMKVFPWVAAKLNELMAQDPDPPASLRDAVDYAVSFERRLRRRKS